VAAPRLQRAAYRFFRFPLVTMGLGPLFMFLVSHRFYDSSTTAAREKHSVVYTNLALLAIIVVAALTIGLDKYILIQLPIIWIGGAAGVWMFYVQHQFEGMVWEHHDKWNYVAAALQGSSFYKLPKVLQWFTGNIGFHHIHHLSPRIANYNLEACHNSSSLFQAVLPVTIRSSMKSLSLRLWDERSHRLVGFSVAKQLRAEQANSATT
jgi:omega-6 fatty acid desaturase (delta-12 desaturase)